MKRVAATLSLALILAVLASAAEAASLVAVTFSGEAYEGPPKFEIKFAGTVIGTGSVEKAIDTAADGLLTNVPSIEPYLQTIEFPVPDDVFTPDGTLEISFLNDAWGGEGSKLDRNLLVARVLVNGRERMLGDFVVSFEGETVIQRYDRGLLLLWKTGVTATADAPAGGWPVAPKDQSP